MDFTFISLSVIHAYDFFISTVINFSYVWYLAGSEQDKAPSWESSSLSKSSEIAVEGRNKTLYCLALGRWFVVIDSFLKKIFKLFQSNGSDINCCQLFFVICSLTCWCVECVFFFFVTDLQITFYTSGLKVFLTLSLPQVTKTEFLLTISIQNQPDKWWEWRKLSILG